MSLLEEISNLLEDDEYTKQLQRSVEIYRNRNGKNYVELSNTEFKEQVKKLKEIKYDLEKTSVTDINKTETLINYVLEDNKYLREETSCAILHEIEFEKNVDDLKFIEVVLFLKALLLMFNKSPLPHVRKYSKEKYFYFKNEFQREEKLQVYFNTYDKKFQ